MPSFMTVVIIVSEKMSMFKFSLRVISLTDFVYTGEPKNPVALASHACGNVDG